MYDFINYVLWELKNSIWLAVPAAFAASAVAAGLYFAYKRSGRRFPIGKAILLVLFLGYFAVLIYATILRGSGGSYREINLHLFRAWREAWNDFSVKNWMNVLLNIALFVPLGGLLPALAELFKRWYLTIPVGFTVSLAIELFQLASCRGICDVDDLFANTLGTVFGYLAVMTVLSLFGKKDRGRKSALAYGVPAILLISAVVGIFVAYEVKEYGNLPDAAAYTNHTSGTRWRLGCELPTVGERIPVYRNQIRSISDCEVFAEEFAKSVDTVFDDTVFYQDAAWFMDHGSKGGAHRLLLSYQDHSFSYSVRYEEDAVWTSTNRETLLNVLRGYPVSVPEYAVFTAEGDGWHSFTVTRYVDGAVMVDGTLRCRYAEDGRLRNLENHLLFYTYYKDVAVISPQEAYERLCSGEFNDWGYFEFRSPEEVTVTACTLEYEIDTKGFYQPVYRFDVVSSDRQYQYRIMIPAIR